jgi:hypothetical protein
MPIAPFIANPPLRFRALPDTLAASHLEASECCLIHADNPLSTSNPILLNPLVKVGYNGSTYDAVHSQEAVMSVFEIYEAIWTNRLRRWSLMAWWREWEVQQRIMMWNKETGRSEKGELCIIDEMQVVVERGWKHV